MNHDSFALSSQGQGSSLDLARYFLWLGTVGFGGPIALVGRMREDLVERRGWISDADYREGLALAQLAPGPLAAQLAIYLGWVRGGVAGATLTGVAFVLPSLLMVLALAALYVPYGGMDWLRGAFYGIGAVVIAIIARSAWRLTSTTLGRSPLLWTLFLANALSTAWTESEVIWLILASGVVALLVRVPRGAVPVGVAPLALAVLLPPAAAGGAAATSLGTLLGYFAGAGLFVFGSGLAIVPFLHGGVVGDFAWLTERQFLDAVAVSMITPGPVVITVAFIGYLVAGPAGALAAAVGVFVPAYLVVVVLAPSFRRIAKDARVKACVDGVTAAATGAIAGAVIVLGRRALVDVTTVALAVLALAVPFQLRRGIPEPLLILGAGALGVALR